MRMLDFASCDKINSKNQDKNETSSPFNITDIVGSTNSSDAAIQSSEVTADFNGDGFEDKAIGVPYEDFDTVVKIGAVHVIYGSPGGLNATAVLADQFGTQNSPAIEDFAEANDFWFLAL